MGPFLQYIIGREISAKIEKADSKPLWGAWIRGKWDPVSNPGGAPEVWVIVVIWETGVKIRASEENRKWVEALKFG